MSKKVFISQPMRGLSPDEIVAAREKAKDLVRDKFGEDVEFIDSYKPDFATNPKPLEFLGESIKMLAQADIAVFIGNWSEARGCSIEFQCAASYGIEYWDASNTFNSIFEEKK
jgi:hypothetical protein